MISGFSCQPLGQNFALLGRRQVHRMNLPPTILHLPSFTQPWFDIGEPRMFTVRDCINWLTLRSPYELLDSASHLIGTPFWFLCHVDFTSVVNVGRIFCELIIGLAPSQGLGNIVCVAVLTSLSPHDPVPAHYHNPYFLCHPCRPMITFPVPVSVVVTSITNPATKPIELVWRLL
jgi:hypothetical protein